MMVARGQDRRRFAGRNELMGHKSIPSNENPTETRFRTDECTQVQTDLRCRPITGSDPHRTPLTVKPPSPVLVPSTSLRAMFRSAARRVTAYESTLAKARNGFGSGK